MFNKLKTSKFIVRTNTEPELLTEIAEYASELNTKFFPEKIVMATNKPSIISEGAAFEGNFIFDGSLHLDGKFKGSIKVDKITIGKSGELDGVTKANTVIVFGEVKGDISCNDLTLNSGSSIDGIVEYSSIKVHEGASVIGQVNHKKS